MADISRKWSRNVPGIFYVDEDCIDCHLFSEISSDNFRNNENGGHDYVHKQPEDGEELTQCKEAMDSCPVEAIGDDSDGN